MKLQYGSMYQTRYGSNATEKNTASIQTLPTARMPDLTTSALQRLLLTENAILATGSTSSHSLTDSWEVCYQSPRITSPDSPLEMVALRPMADEALCYLEPALIDSSLGTGVASINQLSNAAYELILQCAVRQSKGGIATGIGTSQDLKSGASSIS